MNELTSRKDKQNEQIEEVLDIKRNKATLYLYPRELQRIEKLYGVRLHIVQADLRSTPHSNGLGRYSIYRK